MVDALGFVPIGHQLALEGGIGDKPKLPARPSGFTGGCTRREVRQYMTRIPGSRDDAPPGLYLAYCLRALPGDRTLVQLVPQFGDDRGVLGVGG